MPGGSVMLFFIARVAIESIGKGVMCDGCDISLNLMPRGNGCENEVLFKTTKRLVALVVDLGVAGVFMQSGVRKCRRVSLC